MLIQQNNEEVTFKQPLEAAAFNCKGRTKGSYLSAATQEGSTITETPSTLPTRTLDDNVEVSQIYTSHITRSKYRQTWS